MNETYIFKVGPEYTNAYYVSGMSSRFMPEWAGRTAEEFNAGMKGRGFSYRTDEYELSGGRKFVEHIWER